MKQCTGEEERANLNGRTRLLQPVGTGEDRDHMSWVQLLFKSLCIVVYTAVYIIFCLWFKPTWSTYLTLEGGRRPKLKTYAKPYAKKPTCVLTLWEIPAAIHVSEYLYSPTSSDEVPQRSTDDPPTIHLKEGKET